MSQTVTDFDPLALPVAIALLAALDDGDDSALAPLADWLEECGDPRAAGLRLVGDRRPRARVGEAAHWLRASRNGNSNEERGPDNRSVLPVAVFDRIRRPVFRYPQWLPWKAFGSRTDAYLAFAEALAAG